MDAQQARRVLDRLVGYQLSPLLWQKVQRGLSAGRVQSVAVRLVVEREREIDAFVPGEYWTIEADLRQAPAAAPTARSETSSSAALLQSARQEARAENAAEAHAAVARALNDARYLSGAQTVQQREARRSPAAAVHHQHPAAGGGAQAGLRRRKRTMTVAQQLYEGVDLGPARGHVGLITYMRTDSTNVAAGGAGGGARG